LAFINEIADRGETEEIQEENSIFSIHILLNSVQQLPDRYRLVFNLYALDGYSHKEIATLLKISEGTSKSNLSRARTILKTKLEIHQQKNKNDGQ
jgi:RNA polymerase sigma-70 factor (ECF subfamily)